MEALLTPAFGTVVWSTIAFLVVMFLLRKMAWAAEMTAESAGAGSLAETAVQIQLAEADLATRVALLQSAEVFVLPSLVEGLSLALLEAMASGCACVATDAGADGEVLADGAGIVMSTQGVTTQLRTLLPVLRDQPVLTRELGRQARERVLERYTMTSNIDALERLYTDVMRHEPMAA